MNIRQQKYKKNRILGMSMYNSAIAAGYSKYTARKANRIEAQLDDLKDYLERAGITDTKLSELLNQALEAKKVIGYLHSYKKGEKGVEKLSPDEVISNEFLDTEDWPTRLKAMELVLRIKGQLKDKIEHSGQVNFVQMSIVKIESKPLGLDIGDDIGTSRNFTNSRETFPFNNEN